MTNRGAASLLILALISASMFQASAQQIQISKENKTIAITASDEASSLADIAVVTVGFNTYGKDQASTYATASTTSNAIIAALLSSGVPKTAIQSADQSLSPLEPHNDQDQTRYAQGFRFEFAQSWHITVPADQASNVLHIAITSGANDSGGINWQLQHDDALEAEAAKKALEHARQIADQMAKGLGVKLGALVYASNQTPPRGLAALMELNGMTVETSSASVSQKVNLKPLAISPERITKSATVYAVFAIE
jgi:uncharacterized protein YggE